MCQGGRRDDLVGPAQQLGGAALRTAIDVRRGRECLGEPRHIHAHAAAGGDVDMLSTSISGRPVLLSSSTRRIVQPQIGGIGDAEHEVRQRLAGAAAETRHRG